MNCLYSLGGTTAISSRSIADFGGYAFLPAQLKTPESVSQCLANKTLARNTDESYLFGCAYQCKSIVAKDLVQTIGGTNAGDFSGSAICYMAGSDVKCACGQVMRPSCLRTTDGKLASTAFDRKEYCRSSQDADTYDPKQVNSQDVPPQFRVVKEYDTDNEMFKSTNLKVDNCKLCAKYIYDYRLPVVKGDSDYEYMCVVDKSVTASVKFNCYYETYDAATGLAGFEAKKYPS